eukprot:CAMPEP_0202685132 /NCGR_PEP_ID=MMETSP1385-20130828/818_1 /ASSEMBLY_ACC=CAM_ASM_000861 /TAXON_ID=933848 /ORGANISM="Elphidium margaritaceum" /LENGTH=209 /DNA_ID=CAMNT_0049339399 /DNA_START=78 /DNA_END=707 /DNA_ORIENTATION=+
MNGFPIVSTAYLNDEKSFGVATIECPEHMFEAFYDLIQAYADTTEQDLYRARFIRWYLLQDLRVRMRPFWSPSLVASSNDDANPVYTMYPLPLIKPAAEQRTTVRVVTDLETFVFPCPLPAFMQSNSSCSEFDQAAEFEDDKSESDRDCESDDDCSGYDEAFYAQFGIESEPQVIPEHLKNSPDLFWYLCDNHDYDSYSSVSETFNEMN